MSFLKARAIIEEAEKYNVIIIDNKPELKEIKKFSGEYAGRLLAQRGSGRQKNNNSIEPEIEELFLNDTYLNSIISVLSIGGPYPKPKRITDLIDELNEKIDVTLAKRGWIDSLRE